MFKSHRSISWGLAFITPIFVLGLLMIALANPVQSFTMPDMSVFDDFEKIEDWESGVYVGVHVIENPFGVLSTKWWKWLLSIPADTNPLGTGNCDQNQKDPIWFLAGNSGGSVERTCTVPKGKAIFFPIVNAMYYNDPPSEEPSTEIPEEPLTVDDKREELDFYMSTLACNLSSTIDGNPTVYSNPTIRVQSPPFRIEFIENNVYGVEPGWIDEEIVSDGFWVLIQPLSEGEHELHFEGGFCDPDTGDAFFELDVTYKIIVE